MAMCRSLVKMHIKSDDVLFTILLCHPAIEVGSPLLDFIHSLDVSVVRCSVALEIDSLIAECHHVHYFVVTAENELHNLIGHLRSCWVVLLYLRVRLHSQFLQPLFETFLDRF